MYFNVTRRVAVSRQGFIAVIHNDEILVLDAKLVPQHRRVLGSPGNT
jgi:hypothetical protein